MKLDKWQQEALDHDGDLLLCTGRRVGKTYILSRKSIEHMNKHKKPIIVVSLTEDQAMLIIVMAKAYAQEAGYKLGTGRHKPTLKTLTLMVDGTPVKMISRPVGNTGDATRGFEGGVLIVDEASRMPRLFWIAAKPVLLTQAGEIWMCSTPHGKQGYFWKSFKAAYVDKDPEARFKAIYKSTVEVINERPLSNSWTIEQREGAHRILKEDRKDMDELEFGQEYLGLFLDEMRQYFTDELIERVCILQRRQQKIPQRTYYLGSDLAGMGRDDNTYEIFEKKDRDTIEQVENITEKKTLFAARKIADLNREYKTIKKIGIDDGGVGFGIWSELMRNNETKRKTLALNNSSRETDHLGNTSKKLLKEEMYENAKWLMESNRALFLDDDTVKQSLRSIQFKIEEKETGRSKTKIFGSDSHITEGMIRALWLCVKDKSLKPMAC